MTVFEWAIYRYAAGLMTPEELKRAQALAQKSDSGDSAALLTLQELTNAVLADAESRQPSAKKK